MVLITILFFFNINPKNKYNFYVTTHFLGQKNPPIKRRKKKSNAIKKKKGTKSTRDH